MNRLFRALAVVMAAAAALVIGGGVAVAHPLGNFSVNRHTGLVAAPGELRIDHVVDLAEIPTAQAATRLDGDGDGTFARLELAGWAAQRCPEAAREMAVLVNGQPVRLDGVSARARTNPGQAGLPILRLECRYVAAYQHSGGSVVLQFADRAAPGQVGWRELTARGDGATLVESDVPASSATNRLTSYPEDLLASPPDLRSARLVVRPGGPALAAEAGSTPEAAPGLTERLTRRVGSVIGGDLTLTTITLAVLLAVLVGALHAVAPGHGKTMVAFYLASRHEGRVRSALTVGATVTATHTVGVLGLGLLVTAGTAFAPARVYPVLTTVSGALVVGVGVTLVRQALARRAAAPAAGELVDAHAHGHGHAHGHAHGHSHGHGHSHRHHHPLESGLGRSGLVAMGLAGGLLPSPSALVVLLAAVAVGKPWLGVLLVLAFGAGMATTLAGAALFVSRVSDKVARSSVLADRRLAGLFRGLPILLAGSVVVLGIALVARGLAAIS